VSAYAAAVRTVLAKLVLLIAVLLMPLGMTPAAAAGHQPHDMATMPVGHCDPHAPKHGAVQGMAQCTMACSTALPAGDTARDAPLLIFCTPVAPSAAEALDGLHPHPATPPPKAS
jgi:hypothetical protein